MQELVITLISGIGQGAIIGLVAMSLNVLYNATGILNFAQGDLLVVGGVVVFITIKTHSAGVVVLALVLAAAALVGLVMAVQGGLTLARLRSSVDQHSWLVTTLAASAIIESLILLEEGPAPLVVPNRAGSFELAGVRQPWLYPILVAVSIAVYLALHAFHSRTTMGLAMSALRQDLDAARAAGANVRLLQLASFGISGLIIGLAGGLAAPVMSLSQSSGISYALSGFAAAVIGGLGNQLGALIAGPVLGVLTEVATYHLGGQYEQIAPLVLLAVVLLVRPQGVLGQAAPRRV
jgi:branched-chain amino acid transport system permease protein